MLCLECKQIFQRCSGRTLNGHQAMRLEALLLALARIAQRVGHHAALPRAPIGEGTAHAVVTGCMQVAVDPELGERQQVVERIAKAGRAGRQAVARIGTAQAGRKVGDDDGLAVKGLGQCGAQPGLATQRFFTHLGRQKRLAVVR